MLQVVFRRLYDNSRCGYGFYMPNYEFFENNYIPEHQPQAKSLGDGKYQIDEERYIVCEEK